MSYWGFGRYPRYVPVAEKKAVVERRLKQLRKTNPDIQPVIINGKSVASTWWGKAWNDNLERYADYQNRIERGRSYVRNGAVLDLRITRGNVTALVQGTAGKPYRIEIAIKPLGIRPWKAIKSAVAGKLESAQKLLAGQFPEDLRDIFTAKNHGLFPSPGEIVFTCSCPDWARMCKHVAATLYGIGARLDENPELFFTLRNIAMDELIAQAIQDTVGEMLRETTSTSSRVLEDNTDLSALFGIELADDPAGDLADDLAFESSDVTSRDNPLSDSPVSHKPSERMPATSNTGPAGMPIEQVRRVMQQHPDGVSATLLLEQTRLQPPQVYNLLALMKRRGQVKMVADGVYVAVD